jgi:hypothetical protein
MATADFLDQKRHEITARLKELKPLVDEYHRLDAAAAALDSMPPSTQAAPATQRAPARATAARARKRGATHRRTARRSRTRRGHASRSSHQSLSALAVSSGPLSQRINAGAVPRSATRRSRVATVLSAWMRAVTLDREGFARELVDDVQQLQGPPVGGLVELEVQRPHMIGALGT